MKKSLALAFSLGMLLSFSPSMHASDRKDKVTLKDRKGDEEEETFSLSETRNLSNMLAPSDVVSYSLATAAVSLGMQAKNKGYDQLTREDVRNAAFNGAVVGGILTTAFFIDKEMRATYYFGCYCVGKAQDFGQARWKNLCDAVSWSSEQGLVWTQKGKRRAGINADGNASKGKGSLVTSQEKKKATKERN